MSPKIVMEHESTFDFTNAVIDIAKPEETEKLERKNAIMNLNRDFKTLNDNFAKSKKPNPNHVKKIFEFCETSKASLEIKSRDYTLNLLSCECEVDIEISQLMTYIAYYRQSADYIQSLEDEMRVIALEKPGKVLDTLCNAIQLDGVFYKSVCHTANRKFDGKFATTNNYELQTFLEYVIEVFLAQMFFVIKQFTFLADFYRQKGNLTKFREYLQNAFLHFKQMKSQLVGEGNLIEMLNTRVFLPYGCSTLMLYQTLLKQIDYPEICDETAIETDVFQILHDAAFQVDLEVIKTELTKRPNDVNSIDSNGFALIHCAVVGGVDVLKQLLNYEALEINAQTKAALTALHLATINNFPDAVRVLLRSPKIDVNMACEDGWTALHIAVSMQHLEIVGELLKIEALDVNAKIFCQITALHIAVKLDDKNLVQMLLERGAKIEDATQHGLTAKQIAGKFDCLNAIKALENFLDVTQIQKESLKVSVDALAENSTQQTNSVSPSNWEQNDNTHVSQKAKILQEFPTDDINDNFHSLAEISPHTTASMDNSNTASTSNSFNSNKISTSNLERNVVAMPVRVSLAAKLLKEFSNEQNDGIDTQLFQAVLRGELAGIKSMITEGADISKAHKSGKNALDFALINGSLKVFTYFLEEAKFDLRSFDILLFEAAKLGSFDIVRYMIEEKLLSPHLKSDENKTLLCVAIEGGNLEIVKYLIEDQCVAVLSTPENCPLSAAIQADDLKMVKYFLENGLSILGSCDEQRPILTAAKKSSLRLFLYLLETGASIDVKSNDKGVFDYAAIGGNSEILNYLVKEKNYKLNSTIAGSSLSTFFQVARVAKLKDIKYFVEVEKSNVQEKGHLGGTILHEAAFNMHSEVVRYLVEELGLDVKARDNDSFLPLFYAAQQNNLEVVKYFVSEKKLGVHLKDKNGRTILHIAGMSGSLDVVRYLVEVEKAKLNAKDNDGFTPLLASAQKSSNCEIIFYLIEQGCDVEALTVTNANILHFAAKLGDVNLIRTLTTTKRMDINAKDCSGQTPLFYAALAGQFDAVKYLKEREKVKFYEEDNKGQNVHSAVSSKFVTAAQVKCNFQLIEYLFDSFTYSTYTRLHAAAKYGNVEIIKMLCKYRGTNVNVKCCVDQWTPLFYAVESGQMETVQYLVDSQGAHINALDKNLQTPLFWAVRFDHFDIVKFLVERGSKVDVKDKMKRRPIYYAKTDVQKYLKTICK